MAHVNKVQPIRVKIIRKAAIRVIYLSFPTPPTNRSQTCAYVTRMKNNISRSFEPRNMIPIHVSVAVNVPGVTSMLHSVRDVTCGARDFQGHTK
jgi:hypothetical protein